MDLNNQGIEGVVGLGIEFRECVGVTRARCVTVLNQLVYHILIINVIRLVQSVVGAVYSSQCTTVRCWKMLRQSSIQLDTASEITSKFVSVEKSRRYVTAASVECFAAMCSVSLCSSEGELSVVSIGGPGESIKICIG